MNNHIDISINYNGRQALITVQILSSELPKIVYSVTPKDEELKKDFENLNLYFIMETVRDQDFNYQISHSVIYDFKTKILKIRDLEFEFAVWNVLTQLENN
jgi:hypothetical protein